MESGRNPKCQRCGTAQASAARYCAQCGLPVIDAPPGRVPHPRPQPIPPDFVPCEDAAHLYFRTESTLGGQPLLETEGLRVQIFNAGFDLADARFAIRGLGQDNRPIFAIEGEIDVLAQGAARPIDVPSYEMNDPVRVVHVRLVRAEFLSGDAAPSNATG